MNAPHLPTARTVLAALSFSTLYCLAPSLRADDTTYPYAAQGNVTVRGVIRRVDTGSDHLTVVGDDDHVYVVDAYGADIILRDALRPAEARDLERGMRVRARGTLVGDNLLEAQTVRVIGDAAVPREEPPAPTTTGVTLDGVVRLVDPERGRITVADADGARDIVDTLDAAITLPGRAAGQTADLARGMRVSVAGTRLAGGALVADRVRVLPDAPAEAAVPAPAPLLELPPLLPAPRVAGGLTPPSPDPQAVLANLDRYTGILIDARHLAAASRSPSPAIYGPEPGESLLYPDRSHVPTPDEVQDESVVRYYHSEAEARAGVAGDNPLILPAQAVLTPAKDSLQLSADDMVLFNALEKKLHYTQTWKVGFLIAGNQ